MPHSLPDMKITHFLHSADNRTTEPHYIPRSDARQRAKEIWLDGAHVFATFPAVNIKRCRSAVLFKPSLLRTNLFIGAVSVGLLASLPCSAAQRTQSAAPQAPVSDLEKQNLNLVGASASDIKTVLVADPGLMVEVRRWIAKDANDHGQVLSETDLTQDAIFDRLETDAAFRSAATLILRQYGHLLPKVDPDSVIGKQQDLLIQERVKWLVQQEEQDRARVIQQTQTVESCESQPSQDACRELTPAKQNNFQLVRQPASNIAPGQYPEQEETPGVLSTPTTRPTTESLERASLALPLDQNGSDLAMLGLAPGDKIAETLTNASSLSAESTLSLSGPGLSDASTATDLTSLATGPNLGFAALLGGGSSDQTQAPRARTLDTVSPAHPLGTPLMPLNYIPPSSDEIISNEPRMVRAASPYRDIPSLYDMYLQAAPNPREPTRFGSEIFENGSRDPQLIPTDMPAGPDYVVGPGDGLTIDLWGGVSQHLERVVDREGRVSLPEAGPLLVSGKSLSDVQGDLERRLKSVFRDESAAVSLSRLRTIRVYEVGDIQNPGAYDISSLSTPLNALFAAGGPTSDGSLRLVKHYRNNQLIEEVDLYDLLLHGVRSGMSRLENGDTVLVPPVGPQVTVEGMVRRPAIYELNHETSLSSVLELAGGLLSAAALRHIEVQRLVAHNRQTMLSLDLPDSDTDTEITKKLQAFQIQGGDRIRIFPIAPYNEDVVYLEGHVLRPGRFAYHTNMRVSDLIASYKDLLPEPAPDYAEIIRLNPPDFHPTVQSFDINVALRSPSQSPLLAPMDTVRIFSRFDFQDPPSVSVVGDVRMPGTYATSGQIHLSDAVHLAGGLSANASTQDAQVFRTRPDGEGEIFSVSLSAALAGDSAADILLDSRDRLLIHENPSHVQPAIVYVEGDIASPGRYLLAANMSIADLIRAGGGMKPSADTQFADLTHYERSKAGDQKVTAQHETVTLSSVLSDDKGSNTAVHDGDVLTIRQVQGWDERGAFITLKGEIKHPGTYGIKPGETLSSIIERAGGFTPTSYPRGAVLQRPQVREIESKQQDELILRVKNSESELNLLPDNDPKTKQAKEAALAQYNLTLTQLSANPPLGRIAIRISDRVDRWKNTSADVEVHGGDTLTVPTRPGYVMVTGQVFDPTAVSYRPSRSAKWYLSQSGGPTTSANKKAIFVVRADGSVISSKDGLWGDALTTTLEPGDTVVVPEKAVGGGPNWQNIFTSAQLATSVASTVFIALHY
jgi:protein involved in polysaccharide export with SLBB domain